MFKGITTRFDTTSTNDLDFRFQALVESMNVCQVPRNAVKTGTLSSLTLVRTSAERVALKGEMQVVTNMKLKVG